MIMFNNLLKELEQLQQKTVSGFDILQKIHLTQYNACSKDIVYCEDKVRLFHYKPLKKTLKTPLLVVFALINRPDILDLAEEYSFIKCLLEKNLDVYLIDWGDPDHKDAQISLSTYITGYLKHCVEFICNRSGQEKINVLGICQGGVFSLCYASLFPQQIKNLITIVTPVDFHTPDNLLQQLVKNIDVPLIVKTIGNIPGAWMTQAFISLKPFNLLSKKYYDLARHLDDESYVRHFLTVEKWIHDSRDLAGKAFHEFIEQFYYANKLISNQLVLSRRKVNLRKITMPVLNIIAKNDNIIPPNACTPLAHCIGTKDYTTKFFSGGHIGILIGKKSQKSLSSLIYQWLKQRM